MKPSTRSLDALPPIDALIRRSKALAMLDAILSPAWEYRYYSFDSNWGPGEMMASMRNGSGDAYFILFDEHGAAIKGFDHEAVMSPWSSEPHDIWPGIYDSLPVEFGPFRDEPAFSMSDVTFCIWRQYSDAAWQCGVREFPQGDDPDGSKWMLEILDGNPATYRAYARDYFEVDLPITAIRHIYDLKPVDDDVVRALNGELTAAMVDGDVRDIGYPRGAGGHQV